MGTLSTSIGKRPVRLRLKGLLVIFTVLRYDSGGDGLLLVIFTSMKNTTDRDVIQLNTIKNWAQFMPQVKSFVVATTLSTHLSVETTFSQSTCVNLELQWRLQDFLEGGANPKVEAQTLFLAKNSMKLKQYWTERRACVPSTAFRSATELCIDFYPL